MGNPSSAYINIDTGRIALRRKTAQMLLGLGSLPNDAITIFCLCATRSPEKLQLVRLALLAAGKRGAHPRVHFGEQISEAKYACAHRDAEKARAEKLVVVRLHELAKLPQFPPDDPEILNM